MTSSINFDPLEYAMKQAIDMAVHQAVERTLHSIHYKQPINIDQVQGELYRTATVAATNACEQLKTYLHSEWRLVQAEYERAAKMISLQPPPPMVAEKDKK